MDNLIAVLNKLGDSREAEVTVKKAVVEYSQNEQRSQAETLVLLNEVLKEWGKKPVTLGCVKHHWKKQN
ncbi:hypothetical protein [Bacillus nitratireducens]|uniref:hypothetical protein n=1 Tax=Bacillus nitratireducens TaxID=2026193 RepID=UPI0028442623|nr:hypothetical protein [Bacillus nitratireducens]MDR4170368.1 hypothetical protein [Bacillus nitratireducens]